MVSPMATVAITAAVSEICDKTGNLLHFENSATFLEFCYKVGTLVFLSLKYSAMFAVYELLARDN